MNHRLVFRSVLVALSVATLSPYALAQSTTPAEQLQRFTSAAAGATADAARGKQLFNTVAGREVSCASCHNQPPTTVGRHASSGKTIEALAPAFNALRFTDQAKVDKWFTRNCKDVFARECSPAEKADVMAYLISLKR
jgi:predicted amidophosphoribosyltransferase